MPATEDDLRQKVIQWLVYGDEDLSSREEAVRAIEIAEQTASIVRDTLVGIGYLSRSEMPDSL
ncbi:MAG: hypothetical protein Kow00100_14800 [Geothermobacteraceae bacterium]